MKSEWPVTAFPATRRCCGFLQSTYAAAADTGGWNRPRWSANSACLAFRAKFTVCVNAPLTHKSGEKRENDSRVTRWTLVTESSDGLN